MSVRHDEAATKEDLSQLMQEFVARIDENGASTKSNDGETRSNI